MGKNNIRVLPPLVHGKLTSIVEFSLDEMQVTENVIQSTNSDFLIQVMWWGETNPLFLRPKRIQVIARDGKHTFLNVQSGHSIKYEIRTKPKLFKSYLSKCDSMELGVLDTGKNQIIGSAQLKNLLNLVYNSQYYTNVIINDYGDKIGEISYHFHVTEFVLNDEKKCDSAATDENILSNNDHLDSNFRFKLNLNSICSPREKILSNNQAKEMDERNNHALIQMNYMENVEVTDEMSNSNLHCNSQHDHYDLSIQDSNFKNEHNATKFGLNKNPAPPQQYLDNQKHIDKTDTSSVLEDKSKVPSIKSMQKLDFSKQKNACIVNKKSDNSKLNVKSIPRPMTRAPSKIFMSRVDKNKPGNTDKIIKVTKKDVDIRNGLKSGKITTTNSKPSPKPNGIIKTFSKVSKEISKLNGFYLEQLKNNEANHPDLENVPVREAKSDNCLNYVKGGGNESNKVKFLPETYPDDEIQLSKADAVDEKDTNERINVGNKLFFNLNDPVEKIYYETFFGKCESTGNEFEVAELLNQPENKYVLELNSIKKIDCGETKQLTESKLAVNEAVHIGKRDCTGASKTYADSSACEESDGSSKNNTDLPPPAKNEQSSTNECGLGLPENWPSAVQEYKSTCDNCKCCRKLNELDKIIEALKHFETRLKEDLKPSSCGESLPHHRNELQSDVMYTLKNDNGMSDENGYGECGLGQEANESDFSKEDSDFLEFTQYLTKR